LVVVSSGLFTPAPQQEKMRLDVGQDHPVFGERLGPGLSRLIEGWEYQAQGISMEEGESDIRRGNLYT
jgi:hypothetical protein